MYSRCVAGAKLDSEIVILSVSSGNINYKHLLAKSRTVFINWFARQQPRETVNRDIVHSLGHYIFSGAVIPSRDKARSRVNLKDPTKQILEFSNSSSCKSKTFTFS